MVLETDLLNAILVFHLKGDKITLK